MAGSTPADTNTGSVCTHGDSEMCPCVVSASFPLTKHCNDWAGKQWKTMEVVYLIAPAAFRCSLSCTVFVGMHTTHTLWINLSLTRVLGHYLPSLLVLPLISVGMNKQTYHHGASVCTDGIVLFVWLNSIQTKLPWGDGPAAARWSAAELSQLRTSKLSTKDTCHLETHWVEKSTAAAEQPSWIELNTTLKTATGRGCEWISSNRHHMLEMFTCDLTVNAVNSLKSGLALTHGTQWRLLR